MAGKTLLLYLKEEMGNKLRQDAKKKGFSSLQQYIYELLRRNLYEKSNAGRPKKKKTLSDIDLIGLKKVFAKKGGEKIDV